MTYNVGPCRDCGEVVERDVANICFECWAVVDRKHHDDSTKKDSTGVLLRGMPVDILHEEE